MKQVDSNFQILINFYVTAYFFHFLNLHVIAVDILPYTKGNIHNFTELKN